MKKNDFSQELKKFKKELKEDLDDKRYQHTLGVMYTAAALAMAHGEDLEKAQLAGLLHDCAKCIPDKKKIKMCEKRHLPVSDYERANPFMLHARLGAVVAEEKYGITDPDILQSIVWHTTGKPEMTRLEKIIFIADYIEPMRDQAKDLPIVRPLAFSDLDKCMYVICKDTLDYLSSIHAEIDDMTRQACEYYRDLYETSGKENKNGESK